MLAKYKRYTGSSVCGNVPDSEISPASASASVIELSQGISTQTPMESSLGKNRALSIMSGGGFEGTTACMVDHSSPGKVDSGETEITFLGYSMIIVFLCPTLHSEYISMDEGSFKYFSLGLPLELEALGTPKRKRDNSN